MRNKIIKIFVIIVVVLLTSWFTVFMVDRNQTQNLKEPIFAKFVSTTYKNNDIKKENYKGIGYKIEIDRINNQIISSTIYMFNNVVAGVIT